MFVHSREATLCTAQGENVTDLLSSILHFRTIHVLSEDRRAEFSLVSCYAPKNY
jgi:hypothetical protein